MIKEIWYILSLCPSAFFNWTFQASPLSSSQRSGPCELFYHNVSKNLGFLMQ